MPYFINIFCQKAISETRNFNFLQPLYRFGAFGPQIVNYEKYFWYMPRFGLLDHPAAMAVHLESRGVKRSDEGRFEV